MRAHALAVAACLLASPVLAQTDEATQEAAHRAAVLKEFRLTPAMIEELARRYGEERRTTGRARAQLQDASPRERRVNMKFGAGDATSILEVSAGFPTVACFFDGTGQPWPVAQDVNSNPAGGGTGGGNADANPDGFTVHRPVPNGNCLVVAGQGERPLGGIVAFLQGAPAPLTFKLLAGRNTYDAKVMVHLTGRGPNARADAPSRASFSVADDPNMDAVLNGITPPGARPLTVVNASPDNFRAWKSGRTVYLLTTLALVAPEPTDMRSAEHGLTAYAVQVGGDRAYDDVAFVMSSGDRNFTVRVRGN